MQKVENPVSPHSSFKAQLPVNKKNKIICSCSGSPHTARDNCTRLLLLQYKAMNISPQKRLNNKGFLFCAFSILVLDRMKRVQGPIKLFFAICVLLGKFILTSCPGDAQGRDWNSPKSEQNSHLRQLSPEHLFSWDDIPLPLGLVTSLKMDCSLLAH